MTHPYLNSVKCLTILNVNRCRLRKAYFFILPPLVYTAGKNRQNSDLKAGFSKINRKINHNPVHQKVRLTIAIKNNYCRPVGPK